jgi:hypothetical protein
MDRAHRPRLRVREVLLAAALGACGAAHAALPVFVDPASGALVIGNAAPGDWKVKVEVGPAAGDVRVVDELSSREYRFGGIRRIDSRTGAGNEVVEFDIRASQSLALNVDTGSGRGQVKIQWRVPRGLAATVSSLAMASGGGAVDAEVDFSSETASSRFVWTNRFGGGDKTIKGRVAFESGSVDAFQNLNFARLGGGTHKLELLTESKARFADLRFDGGTAQDARFVVSSTDPGDRLAVTARTRAARAAIEVQSAAPDTRFSYAGGVATVADAELLLGVAQTVPGTIDAKLQLAPSVARTKVEAAFEGSGGTLALGGALRTGGSGDQIKVESKLPTRSGLVVDAGDGNNVVELLFSERLTGTAVGLPSIRTGAGNDTITLLARRGSTAVPAIDCGAGIDTAKASVGTATGCETFGR